MMRDKYRLIVLCMTLILTFPVITEAVCIQPPSGMIGWWPGDGNANDIVGGHNGTVMNGATFAPGMVSQGFSHDGADDYVNIPDNSSLNPTAITVDAWFYTTDIVGQLYPPIVKKADLSAGYALEIDSDDSQIRFWVYVSGTGWRSSAAVPISTNTWYHATGTYDGSSIRIYLDGQPQGSPTIVSGTIAPSSNPLNIGRDPSNTSRLFEGLIDEVEIFNRALSASEILQIYNAGSDGKCKSSATVPTMNEWGMIIFMVLAGLGAVYYLRSNKTAKSS
jgi:hypothetical protein